MSDLAAIKNRFHDFLSMGPGWLRDDMQWLIEELERRDPKPEEPIKTLPRPCWFRTTNLGQWEEGCLHSFGTDSTPGALKPLFPVGIVEDRKGRCCSIGVERIFMSPGKPE